MGNDVETVAFLSQRKTDLIEQYEMKHYATLAFLRKIRLKKCRIFRSYGVYISVRI